MTPRFIDWIWHIKGSLPLAPAQSSEEAFQRLDPLFQERGTTYERSGDRLTFSKTNIAAQDKMAVFDKGYLQVEEEPSGPVLRYSLKSKALLFCFLAPLLFLSFAGMTITVGKWEKEKAAAEASDKKDEKKEDPAEKYAAIPLHPIDQFLGAPAPQDPKDKAKAKEDKKEQGPSPTPAYVFAGLFAVLYVFGRIFEHRVIRKRFIEKLQAA